MTGNLTVLLTGATGLVGRFVLAELLRRQVPTIVLARAQQLRDAHSRIDEALAEFERHTLLPRPIVLEADLCEPGLGLTPEARALLKKHPLRVIHSAASIRFQAASPDGEPYRSNVGGTQNLLDFAGDLQVKQFHHVSTAYVQCNRHLPATSDRTAFEIAVPPNAIAGNDYERSKIQSEQSVRQCGHIGPVSIYRPSIVVGDSRSGYTSTYHGFYAPLQIAAAIAGSLGIDRTIADLLRQQMGLKHGDSKNLVPVDWLAAAIVHLVETPSALGGIYHLTHPQPARLEDMQNAILDALEGRSSRRRVERAADSDLPAGFTPEVFHQQMQVYQSYFQDDPPFDRSQVEPYLCELPCPPMDYAALKHLASVAIENNFGWPRPTAPLRPTGRLSLDHHKAGHTDSENPLRDICFELSLLGTHQKLDRGQSTLAFCRTQGKWKLNSVLSSNGIASHLRVVMTEQTLISALSDPKAAQSMIDQGRLILKGPWPRDCVPIVRDWLQQLVIVNDQNLT